jgi:hypothetical protein
MRKKISPRLNVSDFRTLNSLELADNIRNKFPRMDMFLVTRADGNIDYQSVSFIYATDMYERLKLILTDKDLCDEVFEATTECNISRVYDDGGDCIRDYVRNVFIARLNVIFHKWNESNAVLKIAGIMK